MAVVARRHATDESTTMRHLASRDGLHEGAFEVSRSRSAWSAPGMAGWQGMRRRPQFPCHLHGRDRCHGDCRKTGRAAAKATSCGATCRHRVTKMVTWAADGIQLPSPAKSSPWCSIGMAKHRSGRCQNLRRIETARSRTIIPKKISGFRFRGLRRRGGPNGGEPGVSSGPDGQPLRVQWSALCSI